MIIKDNFLYKNIEKMKMTMKTIDDLINDINAILDDSFTLDKQKDRVFDLLVVYSPIYSPPPLFKRDVFSLSFNVTFYKELNDEKIDDIVTSIEEKYNVKVNANIEDNILCFSVWPDPMTKEQLEEYRERSNLPGSISNWYITENSLKF